MRKLILAMSRNLLSLVGAALATGAAILFLAILVLEILGLARGPYAGIIGFVVVPSFFVVGLLFIPFGLRLERRRAARAARDGQPPPSMPVWNLNDPDTRKSFLLFVALTLVNLAILGVAAYKGIEVMDSTAFCGGACHSVMAPEYANYTRSPHARVACVDCHIGPGANWFVKSKLSGSWQLVAVTFNLYPRPIPTPVENLRPARETCEQCHWPTKFVGDRLKVITHFNDDETNSETKTVLLLRVGGIEGRVAKGIHWHVDPTMQIRYLSDPKRDEIGEVEMTLADGTRKVFKKEGASGKQEERVWRTMDCVDCHNRPTHIYRMPSDEIDTAIQQARIDRALPYVRREALKAIQTSYSSHDEAKTKIRAQILDFYAQNYPDIAKSKAEAIAATADELGRIYCLNVWPSMKIAWGTYANHIGHQHAPGCFRCHDDEHKTATGETISQDCMTCHTLLAQEEAEPAILRELNP